MVQSEHDDQQRNSVMWNALYEHHAGNRFPNEYLVKFVSFINQASQFKELKALDIGFGGFANLSMCHELGYEPFGVEVSQHALDKATAALDERGVPFVGSLFEPPILPFEDETLL